MAPNKGLVHLKEYDIKDSNVELIGTALDHRVKYQSAQTEPAWNDGRVGIEPGLLVWRIERFEVVPWPEDRHGQFYDGDSYIVLNSWKLGKEEQAAQEQQQQQDGEEQQQQNKLGHEIFFWLGKYTSQDEAGTAAYKTVELDEFLRGHAIQHRELQKCMSDEFVALFPRIKILSGGVESGFRHVEEDPEDNKEEHVTLLRVFKLPAGNGGRDSIMVHEVPPSAASLDDNDVFVLDAGGKIWVWQGRSCSPMEKAKAAQVVHDMTLAKHVEVEVLSQAESRSSVVVSMLGGKDAYGPSHEFKCTRPVGTRSSGDDQGKSQQGQAQGKRRPRRLFRLSDASGRLEFTLVKDGEPISQRDLDGNDVFLLDDEGREIWVWQGRGASKAEKSSWLSIAQQYVRRTLEQDGGDEEDLYLTPIAKVNQGDETRSFMRALQVN